MSDIDINTGYEPRPLQAEIHRSIARFSVLAIHRRFGKTVLAINHGIDYGLKVQLPNARVSFISPLYKQSKTVAWDYLKQYTYRIPGVKQYESELRVDIPMGTGNTFRFQLFGADNPDSLRGMYHDYAIFDEFGNQHHSIWNEVVSPALADRIGGALFLGTPCGKNHFYKLYQEYMKRYMEGDNDYFAATYRADETGVLPEKELALQKKNMPESDYRQEFLCDWAAAIKGAYYADDISRLRDEGHIQRVPYIKELPVFVSFDLGVDDATACWFIQCHRDEIRVINYKEFTDTGLLDVLKEIKEMPYNYAEMVMPWDIGHREGNSGRPRLEAVENMGFDVIVAPKWSIEEGIQSVRAIINQCWFDIEKTQDGIACLENYRKKYDPRTSTYLLRPEHDEFSHGADSMRTFAVAYTPQFGELFRASGLEHPNRRVHKVKKAMS